MKTKKKARVFDKRKEEEEENERYYENLDAFIRFFFLRSRLVLFARASTADYNRRVRILIPGYYARLFSFTGPDSTTLCPHKLSITLHTPLIDEENFPSVLECIVAIQRT